MIQDIEEESKTKFSMDVEFSFSFKECQKGQGFLLFFLPVCAILYSPAPHGQDEGAKQEYYPFFYQIRVLSFTRFPGRFHQHFLHYSTGGMPLYVK